MRVLLLFCFAVFLACTATAANMTEVPVVGAMTSTDCEVHLRTDAPATVQIEYADNADFVAASVIPASSPSAASDYRSVVLVPREG